MPFDILRKPATVVLLAVFITGLASQAFACACCANPGHRFVERVELDDMARELLTSVAFASTAEVAMGEQDYEEVEGITFRSLPLDISVRMDGTRWTFNFDDRVGNAGHLIFDMPNAVTRFEVDPRDPNAVPTTWGGPLLYKEWRLSAPAVGDGLIRDSVGGDQMATLILQGRGSACTYISGFNAWALVLYGSKAQVELYGDLVPPVMEN